MSKKTSFVKVTGLLLPLAFGCGEDKLVQDVSSNPPAPEPEFSNPPAPEPEPVSSEGEEIFASSCSGCHGADGDSGSAPQLSSVVPLLDDEELTDVIVNGIGSMPGGLVQEEGVSVLVSYLRDTFQ